MSDVYINTEEYFAAAGDLRGSKNHDQGPAVDLIPDVDHAGATEVLGRIGIRAGLLASAIDAQLELLANSLVLTGLDVIAKDTGS